TVTQATKAGWDLTSIVCDDGTSDTSSSGDVSTRTATFNVDPGETVNCTFTNTKDGSIVVKMVSASSSDAAKFTVTGDASGTIGDTQTITVNNLAPGTYTSTEAAKSGWDLTSLTCNDGSSATASSGDTSTRTATFKLDPGETVTCTFTNTKRGSIVVKKVTNPASDTTTSFGFTGDAGGSIHNGETIEVDNPAPGI